MSLTPNIDTTGFYSRPTDWYEGSPCCYTFGGGCGCACVNLTANVPSGSAVEGKAEWYANGILDEWNIRYTTGTYYSYVGLIPFNEVRDPDSEWHIECQDMEGILAVAGNEYSNAQDRYDMCSSGWNGNQCKCNANIDRKKWKYIFDWAEIVVQYQQSNNDVDSCIVESFEDANIEINQQMQDMLNNEEDFGLTNNTMLAIVSGLTLVSLGVILKYVK